MPRTGRTRPRRLALPLLAALAALAGTAAASAQAPSPAAEVEARVARGEIGAAIELGLALLPAHGEDPALREQLGRAYFLLSEALEERNRSAAEVDAARRSALVHLAAARERAPTPPARVFLAMATLHHLLGELAEAERLAGEGLAIRPDEPALRSARARARAELGRWQDSIEDWDAVLRAAPSDVDAAVARSEAWNQLGKPCDAAQRLIEACIAPGGSPKTRDDWRAHYNIGRFWLLCRHYEDAVAPFDRAAELAPGNGMVAIERAENLYRVGRIAEASAEFDRWLAAGAALERPQRLQALYRRGRIAAAAGESARARAAFEETLALDPAHEGALSGLGALLRSAGETEAAERILERYRRLAPIALDLRIAEQMIRRLPSDPRPRIQRIELLIGLPEISGARAELDDFARRFPRHRQLAELRRRLEAAEGARPPGGPR